MNLAREIQQKYKIGETNFAEWNLYRQNLSFQILDGSDFSKSDLSYANLSSTSLKNTNFHQANLSCTNCFKADFSGANLTGTNFTAATLSEANFLNAIYDQETLFPQGFDPLITGAILQTQHLEDIQETIEEIEFNQENSISSDSEPSFFGEIDSSPPAEDSPTSTLIVSPAPELDETTSSKPESSSQPYGKRKTFLIVLIALLMPAFGGVSFLVFRTYQNFQQEQSILKAIKSHRDNQDYESCLNEISQAEEAQIAPTPFSNFLDQLDTIKATCQEKFAAQQMKAGTELINNEQYEQAILTLSNIPNTTESYGLAQSQITMAGQKYCEEIDIEARESSNEEQFYNVIEKGKSFPTKAPIAQECQEKMEDLEQKWSENSPVLREAKSLLGQGDCEGGRSLSNNLGKSIFRKWQQTSKRLLEEAAECRVPIDVSGILRDMSNTHTFRGVAGQSVKIELDSEDFDTFVAFLDSNGKRLGENDDGGLRKNSLLNITLKQTGEFTVKVSAYQNKGTGSYRLKVSR